MRQLYFVLIAAFVFSIGQFSEASAQMMRPVFGPKQEKLSFLLGKFTTESKITMGENTMSGNGYMHIRRRLDSMFVFITSEENNSRMGSYKSFGVLGYDSRDSEYVLTMFNNFGFQSEFKGGFSGDTLELSSQIETPRGTFNQKMDWFKEGTGLRLLVYNDFGQGYTLMVDETAKPAPETKKAK